MIYADENLDEHALLRALETALSEVPGASVSVEARGVPRGADAVFDLAILQEPVRLVVEVKRLAYPRDVREAVYQLRTYAEQLGSDVRQTILLVASSSLSSGARAYLREEGVGYYDLGGSLFLPARGAYVFVDRPAPRKGRRKVDAPFAGRRALVLQALWEHRTEWVRVHQLAETAMVSPATASQTLSELERRDWVEARGLGPAKERRLLNPARFLDTWTEARRRAKPPAMRRFFVPASGLDDLVPMATEFFRREGLDYMITGEAAAQIYAPYLSSVTQMRCRVRETAKAISVIEDFAGREVSEGWNLGIIFSKSEGEFAFRQEEREVCLASPLQVYLDLLQGGGRSAEMADHLRDLRLRA